MSDIKYARNATFQQVVEDGFDQISEGEGFEYTVGKVRGGELKVVFEPEYKAGSYIESVCIDGVDGFGYCLAFESDKGK
ncbi:hypothetical protein ACE414_10560 [Alteromonas macleodii]|uniref:hypothetical protein n=1 Tax=Alteromonas macleodii TaxID=28108 RepID=UPI00365941D1